MINFLGKSVMRIHVFCWCAVVTENREVHVLFTLLLPLDINASVVISEQILRGGVWQVQ